MIREWFFFEDLSSTWNPEKANQVFEWIEMEISTHFSYSGFGSRVLGQESSKSRTKKQVYILGILQSVRIIGTSNGFGWMNL